MADPELLQALDYILNRSNASTIEVLAEAVVRRRRNMTIFSAMGNIPDPQKMAEELAGKINEGLNIGMDSMRHTIRDMIIRIVREHAPELTDSQIDGLTHAWMPESVSEAGSGENLPPEMLLSMIEQFISFSHGTMPKSVDQILREEMGAWPQRYWNNFPPVIRQIITDYLKDKITEKDFKSKIVLIIGK
ncbi:MAG: hypothetical protein LBU66_02870 [Treponema sp.]|jgi:hypothetical protein|nr:hypothetical protein [Treponema sp.]